MGQNNTEKSRRWIETKRERKGTILLLEPHSSTPTALYARLKEFYGAPAGKHCKFYELNDDKGLHCSEYGIIFEEGAADCFLWTSCTGAIC